MDKALLQALEAQKPHKLDELERYCNAFFYGEYGVGKTVMAAKYGQRLYELTGKKHLLIRTDSGTDSLYNHPEVLDSIEVVEYDGLSQLKAVGLAIKEQLEGWNYGLVTVDTISQSQEEYLDFLLENYKFSDNSRAIVAPRSRASGLDSMENTGLGDYNLTRRMMSAPIKALIKAPCDVFFLAHLREPNFMEQAAGKITKRPTMTQTVFQLIAREASLMGLMERKGKDRTVLFETGPRNVSKARIKELDDKKIKTDEFPEYLLKWKELI